MKMDILKLIEKMDENTDKGEVVKILAKSKEHEWDNYTTFMLLYREIFGTTLCKDFCEYLVDNMHHDEYKGRKWTVQETNELARKNNIEFGTDYTEDEFNAAVHMMWYDYHNDIKDSGISSDGIYAKMADSYLDDEDAPKGKLVNHFFFILSEDL